LHPGLRARLPPFYVASGAEWALARPQTSRLWQGYVRAVGQHRREALPEAHAAVADALAGEGQWREAERHFVEAKDWQGAVDMYRWLGCPGERAVALPCSFLRGEGRHRSHHSRL
jgi:hypothetical protein